MKKLWLYSLLSICLLQGRAQTKLAPTPPMAWMTWNYFGENINEQLIREIADAMHSSGMLQAGYQYLVIDDGWQGGRDNRNNIIPDPKKFPSGMKALADYVHSKGLKLGIYSDAAPLTCAGYTASLHFEEQDAKTFASWGIDYLKYDYCNAPKDSFTAKQRYKTMADALRKSGRDMVFAVCEWGERQPWHWAAAAGGQLWRTTFDIRDSWSSMMGIYETNVQLHAYAGSGRWNDPDMLIVGLGGNKGPSGDLGGTGCSMTEYQTNMSLWSMMAAPLIATNDVRQMTAEVKRILLHPGIIAINQDSLGLQAKRVVNKDSIDVLLKPLTNGDVAIAILNKSAATQAYVLSYASLGLEGRYTVQDVWTGTTTKRSQQWKDSIDSHATVVLRLKKE